MSPQPIDPEQLRAMLAMLQQGAPVLEVCHHFHVDGLKMRRALDLAYPGVYAALMRQRRATAQAQRRAVLPLEEIMTRIRAGESTDRLAKAYHVTYGRIKTELEAAYGDEYRRIMRARQAWKTQHAQARSMEER